VNAKWLSNCIVFFKNCNRKPLLAGARNVVSASALNAQQINPVTAEHVVTSLNPHDDLFDFKLSSIKSKQREYSE
jgi:hypothetical protein